MGRCRHGSLLWYQLFRIRSWYDGPFFFSRDSGTYRSLAFHFGSTLLNRGQASAGDVINVVFAMIIGSFALATMAPETEGMFVSLGHFSDRGTHMTS